MIASMTGFGKGIAENGTGQVAVEVRSVNGRYGDVAVHLPRTLSELEPRIKECVLGSISRGRVDVAVSFLGAIADQGVPILKIEVLEAYKRGLDVIRERIGASGDVDALSLAALPQVFAFESSEKDLDALWHLVQRALEQAVAGCKAMRLAEGKKLVEDFEKRIAYLDSLIGKVEVLAPARVESVRKRLQEKLDQLLTPERVDENRLMMEIALLAERSDVTEECVRFRSHNAQFLSMLAREEAVGRRLNFLLQEMLREANTIGSKAGDAAIAHLVVDIKEEIEKLKEQVQNIE